MIEVDRQGRLEYALSIVQTVAGLASLALSRGWTCTSQAAKVARFTGGSSMVV